jgi:excisionase family DNA binding protein
MYHIKKEIFEKIFSSEKWGKAPTFLSVKKTAEFLDVSADTVRRLIKEDKLKAIVSKKNKYKKYKIIKYSLEIYIKESVL